MSDASVDTSSSVPVTVQVSDIVAEVTDFKTVASKDSSILPTEQAFVEFYSDVCSIWESRNVDSRILGVLTEYYHYTMPTLPSFRSMIKSVIAPLEAHLRMVDPVNCLVIGTVAAIDMACAASQNVYTPSTLQLLLADTYLDTSKWSNLNVIGYDEITDRQYDFALLAGGMTLADEHTLNLILDSIAPGGVVCINESSIGGEMYGNDSFSRETHLNIKNRGDFDVYHAQGFVAVTTLIKR